jgi:hypothetical protein
VKRGRIIACAFVVLSALSFLFLRERAKYIAVKEWYEGGNSTRLTGLRLRLFESEVFIRNQKLLSSIDAAIKQKNFSSGPNGARCNAFVELDDRRGGEFEISCNLQGGLVTIGVPISQPIYWPDYEYATIKLGTNELKSLSGIIDALYEASGY